MCASAVCNICQGIGGVFRHEIVWQPQELRNSFVPSDACHDTRDACRDARDALYRGFIVWNVPKLINSVRMASFGRQRVTPISCARTERRFWSSRRLLHEFGGGGEGVPWDYFLKNHDVDDDANESSLRSEIRCGGSLNNSQE
ncbi:hypothetical protein J6590_088094 [Homalodisca vitripennis]|nr:hypothetical protein J6590_088094 [Homalodisca vitripennis]